MINLPQAGCPLTLLAAATQSPNQTESFTTSIDSLTTMVMEGSVRALFLSLPSLCNMMIVCLGKLSLNAKPQILSSMIPAKILNLF